MNGHTKGLQSEARDVCIVGVARTPIGAFMGCLSSVPATELGAIAIREALKRANLPPSAVEEVIMGNVLSANLGQAPARQAAKFAGLPDTVVCTTVNKVCASGMKAMMVAAQSIRLGENDVVVAGGMESMSNAPYYLSKARQGYRMGNGEIIDGMQKDGLWDVYNDYPMGMAAEECADEHSFSRKEQDDFAILTNERAAAAYSAGAFDWELVPVEVKGQKGKPSTMVTKDEGPSKFNPEKLSQLRACFKEGGTVTAGNASGINDGAAAVVLVSRQKSVDLGLTVLGVVKGYADAEQSPEKFTTTPALAVPKALTRAGISQEEVDFFEVNEAFSAVALANQKLLSLDSAKLNAHGGAVALGHPLGCSGARIVVTLLGVLRAHKAKHGVAAVCNGGGGASALVVECP